MENVSGKLDEQAELVMRCLYTIFVLCSLLTVPFSGAAARSLKLPLLLSNGLTDTENTTFLSVPYGVFSVLWSILLRQNWAARPVQST